MKPEYSNLPQTFVAKLWGLCNVLRGDGIGYNQYISELTYLLFLKIAKETGAEGSLPEGYRWDDLVGYQGDNLLGHYQEMLTHLGASAASATVRNIYAFPTTVFSHSENLAAVIAGINELNWHSLSIDAIGLVYEGLLAKNSEDSRSGAGQYFTPRALVDCIIECMKPQTGEIIQDPATGTGGFLISADHYVRSHSDESKYIANPPIYQGMEIERGTYRLCLMNAFLHRMQAEILLGDTLTTDAAAMRKANLVLANPPFGTRSAGARATREDFSHSSSNRQLQFLQHIYRGLVPGGRAAVVLPDNVLFEGGRARKVRTELMDTCSLHTILRLPTGIFYAQNVSTHVLFFTKGHTNNKNTRETWIYDLRANMPRFGKRRQITGGVFEDFIACFGPSPLGTSRRKEGGLEGRFRKFTRQEIASNSDELNISWLDSPANTGEEDDPETIAQQILSGIQCVSSEVAQVIDLVAFISERVKRS